MGGRQQRYAVQDRLFAALERLETKETQHAAFEELQRLIRELDAANLSTLLHAAGATTSRTTQFARCSCLRLATMCAQQDRCLEWRAMQAPPLLPKLLGLLSRALHDADSAVRATAAECFGVLAAQLLAASPPGGSALTSGTPANPLLACILDALGEPGGAVQSAAASALAASADALCPGIDPGLLRHLLRALGNPLFLGRAELCGALASLQGGRVRGLVVSSTEQLLGAMPEVLGSQTDGTGLVGALTGKGKDFQLRAAAAHSLMALAAGIGPSWPGSWEAAVAAMCSAKTDVSKPVRDAALAALPVVAGLQDFLASGAPHAAWPEACGRLLAAACGGKGRRLPPGPAGKPAGGAGKTGRPEEASSGGTIPAVWPAGSACQSPQGPVGMGPQLAAGAALWQGPSALLAASMQPPCASPVAAGSACPPTAAAAMYSLPAMAQPHSLPASSATQPGAASSQQVSAQLAAIQEQQARMAAALSAFTASTHGTLHQLQQQLSLVGAGMAALAGSGAGAALQGAGAVSLHHRQQQQAVLQEQLASVGAGMAALALSVDSGSGHLQAGLAAGSSAPSANPPAPHQGQQPRQAANQPESQPKRLSSLHRSYDALKQQLCRQRPDPPTSSPLGGPAGRAGTSAAQAAAGEVSAPGAGSSGTAIASQPGPADPPSCEALYSQLLAGGASLAGDQQAQLRLLRCMAKTGPVWEQLQGGTGQRLMGAVADMLQEGTALKRLLPWLWPLADTAAPAAAAAAAFPADLRQRLLKALSAYPLSSAAPATNSAVQEQAPAGGAAVALSGVAADGAAASGGASALSEKRELLVSALRAVWDA